LGVALGFAKLTDRKRGIKFTDVLQQSIGFSIDSKRFARIVPKNSKLPISKKTQKK
jgi:hypothetical protein